MTTPTPPQFLISPSLFPFLDPIASFCFYVGHTSPSESPPFFWCKPPPLLIFGFPFVLIVPPHSWPFVVFWPIFFSSTRLPRQLTLDYPAPIFLFCPLRCFCSQCTPPPPFPNAASPFRVFSINTPPLGFFVWLNQLPKSLTIFPPLVYLPFDFINLPRLSCSLFPYPCFSP